MTGKVPERAQYIALKAGECYHQLMHYLWLKVWHIIAVVCWFSGLFYLPRLFVYHAMSEDRISKERFKVMERKLYYGITWPSAVLTTCFGLALAHALGSIQAWLYTKMALVVLLWLYHLRCGYHLKQLKQDANHYSHIYFRWFNEAPVLLLIAIVALAVLKSGLIG